MCPRPRKTETDGNDSVRVRILDEAKKLFRQKGYMAVSINDITEAVGVTKPTLYYYFGDKENLYADVLVHMMESGYRQFKAHVANVPDCSEKLRLLAAGYFEFSPTSILTLMRDTQEHLGESAQQKVMTANRQFMLAPFVEIFEGLVEQYPHLAGRAEMLAKLFVSLMDVFTIEHKCETNPSSAYQGLAAELVGMFLHGVLAPKSELYARTSR